MENITKVSHSHPINALGECKMLVCSTFGLVMTIQRMESSLHAAGPAVDEFSEITAYWRSTGELPAELITGHKLIDSEHHFLIAAIANLRGVIDHLNFKDCTGCSHGRQRACEATLVAMLGDVFALFQDRRNDHA